MFSLGRPNVPAVIAYVQNQKRHHADGKTWPQWEETDQEYLPAPDKAHDADPPAGRQAEGP